MRTQPNFLFDEEDAETRVNIKNCSLAGSDQRLARAFQQKGGAAPRWVPREPQDGDFCRYFVLNTCLLTLLIKYTPKKPSWRGIGGTMDVWNFSKAPVPLFLINKHLQKPYHEMPDDFCSMPCIPRIPDHLGLPCTPLFCWDIPYKHRLRSKTVQDLFMQVVPQEQTPHIWKDYQSTTVLSTVETVTQLR